MVYERHITSLKGFDETHQACLIKYMRNGILKLATQSRMVSQITQLSPIKDAEAASFVAAMENNEL